MIFIREVLDALFRQCPLFVKTDYNHSINQLRVSHCLWDIKGFVGTTKIRIIDCVKYIPENGWSYGSTVVALFFWERLFSIVCNIF